MAGYRWLLLRTSSWGGSSPGSETTTLLKSLLSATDDKPAGAHRVITLVNARRLRYTRGVDALLPRKFWSHPQTPVRPRQRNLTNRKSVMLNV